MKLAFCVALTLGLLAGCTSQGRKAPERPLAPTGSASQASTSEIEWTSTKIDPATIAERIDRSLFELEDCEAQFSISIASSDGAGALNGTWKVESRQRYAIEYVDVQRFGVPRMIVADGRWKQEVSRGQRSKRESLPQSWTPQTRIDFSRFESEFSKVIAGPLVDSTPAFLPLINELKRRNFSVKYQVADFEFKGLTRPFGRLLATPTSDKEFEIEIRFDGIRLVPLTIRLTRKSDQTAYIWTASWSFGLSFPASTFSTQ